MNDSESRGSLIGSTRYIGISKPSRLEVVPVQSHSRLSRASMIAEKTFIGRDPGSSLTAVESEEALFEIERKRENWGAGNIYNLDLSKLQKSGYRGQSMT